MTTVIEAYRQGVAEGRLKPDPAQETVLDALERVRHGLAQPPVKKGLFRKATYEPVKGLYLWGGVGRGKSMLMDLVYSMVDVPKRREHFHAFMQWVHNELAKARADGVEDAIGPVAENLAKDVRFLAFDEMQITDITDAMLVGRLFEKLFDAGVTIVTTSNRVPDDLYKNGLNRQLFLPFIALVKDRMEIRELVSDTDHRQGRLQDTKRYFTPLNAENRAAVRAIWDDFAGDQGHPLVLRVKKRDVTLPGFCNGVARATFFDLCGKMLGAGDYLAIAEAVRVLIIEEIPALSRSNFNEAKRFVTLIDALYEAKVEVICSAASEPETLYLEGEGVFEFERTASRLREMQDANWGKEPK
ncbi:cell division protein ZapE [Marivivens niveibacter]|uniref:Cell division protein ZapE n=1 Tax=Marivivens niveibacter TaxID=1930667 RepID=A0A251X0L7_9RHOB|nr:cell division protein ZapE [Marivivens niveibacter]OUD09854.1 cell division protein ZapE [Marivivens niveibacter]